MYRSQHQTGRIALAVLVAAILAACAAPIDVSTEKIDSAGTANGSVPHTTDEVVPQNPGTVDWATCAGNQMIAELDCATIEVPLDYDDPDGPTIEIALARTEALGSDRIGSLLFNPGGPGGSGIDFLTAVTAVIPTELARRFDLVSFDPRGVGASAAIDCDIDFDDGITLLAANDDRGWTDLVEEAESLGEQCTDDSIDLASYVGTNNAARDLDEIREVLGDDQLSYVGFSYGTRLGATYAELFPERVRALVLDGAVKPTDDQTELGLGQAGGFDRALEAFAASCDADPDCSLHESGAALDVYADIVREIDEVGSFPTDDTDRVLTPGELQLGVIAALYSTQLWPILADAMNEAAASQDGTLLQALTDSYVGRRPDGTYEGLQVANLAINCADDPERPSIDIVREQADAAAAASSWFDDSLRADTGCIGTPDPLDPLILGPAEGAAPILVIGNTGDPATPFEWAEELAAFLDSAVLYTVESEGHTAFLSVDCVEDVVVRYLVDLDVPQDGSSCSDPVDDDVFPPPGESEFDQVIALFDCLRDEGIDVPELSVGDLLADPNGEELFEAIDPTDTDFLMALFACEDVIPDL